MNDPESFSFLHVADSHLGIEAPKKTQQESSWQRSDDFMSNFQHVLTIAKSKDIDFLIHAGDVFDRSNPPKHVVKETLSALFGLAKQKPVILLPGNHERSILRAGILTSASKLYVINKPKTIILSIKGKKIGITGFPFIRDNFTLKYDKVMKETGFDQQAVDYHILVMHQVLDTAIVGAQHYVFSKENPNVLPLHKIETTFDYLALGHIHTHQKLLNLITCEAIYAGSLERTSFAERYEKKGYIRVNVGMEEDSLKTSWKFMSLPTRKMYLIKIPLEFPDYSSSNLSLLLRTKLYSLEEGSLVYLQLRVTNIQCFERLQEKRPERTFKAIKQELKFKKLTIKISYKKQSYFYTY